jgi:beta-N-acetylhexosaminidase
MDPARLLMIDLPGPRLDAATRAHLTRYPFGGVCLFRRNIESLEQTTQLVNEIRSILGPQTWVAVDQEGGMVARVLELPLAPAPMALAATDSDVQCQQVGAAVGRGLASLGINWNFAPCLDVNSNPHNPIIGERSFGRLPGPAASLALAWARGLEQSGVMATGKHFPGHGNTHQDSHLTLPTVDSPLELLEATEFYPFRQFIAQGFSSLMTAHLVFTALDAQHPATLSRPILTDLLRQQWGFDGLIVTDAMDMKAITEQYSPGDAVRLAWQAGADMICALGGPQVHAQQVAALHMTLEEDPGLAPQLAASLSRHQRLAVRFPGQTQPYPAGQMAADEALMLEVARKSITAQGAVTLPQPGNHLLLLAPSAARVGAVYEETSTARQLLHHLRQAFDRVELLSYPSDQPLAIQTDLTRHPAQFVLHATTSRTSLHPDEVNLSRLLAASGRPSLHLALWNPYHVDTLGQPALISYGFREPALRALIEVLQGAPPRGKRAF